MWDIFWVSIVKKPASWFDRLIYLLIGKPVSISYLVKRGFCFKLLCLSDSKTKAKLIPCIIQCILKRWDLWKASKFWNKGYISSLWMLNSLCSLTWQEIRMICMAISSDAMQITFEKCSNILPISNGIPGYHWIIQQYKTFNDFI